MMARINASTSGLSNDSAALTRAASRCSQLMKRCASTTRSAPQSPPVVVHRCRLLRFPKIYPFRVREEIARAIESHQVVIVSGETGSGKTTQLPKICLALGRGNDGLIGHTQPRRIAASSIARIAHEPVARRVKSSATRCGSPITLGQALRSS